MDFEKFLDKLVFVGAVNECAKHGAAVSPSCAKLTAAAALGGVAVTHEQVANAALTHFGTTLRTFDTMLDIMRETLDQDTLNMIADELEARLDAITEMATNPIDEAAFLAELDGLPTTDEPLL